MNDGEGGSKKWHGGPRDNNQTNDRIQVFAFARQPLRCLHSLRRPMLSDYSGIIGCQSRGARQQALPGRNDKLKGREGDGGHVVKEVFECSSSGISPLSFANIWLNFQMGSSLMASPLQGQRERERSLEERPGKEVAKRGNI